MEFPKGFRKRRGINWFFIGLLYASYYMCRYNFRFAAPGLQSEFGYTIEDISFIFATWSAAYGVGQIINGLITDQIGGRISLLIGAICTITINLILGFSSLASQFFTLALLALVNGYTQSFGAPGMIKINAAWFRKKERGLFAGIFGGMIQLGQVSISQVAPLLLNGGLVLGTYILIEAGQWRSVFIFPPVITAVSAILFFFIAAESPNDCGFKHVTIDPDDLDGRTRVSLKTSFKTIIKHPFVWYYAVAYACTGGVRHSLDQLSVLYFRDQLGFDMKSQIPLVASITLMTMPLVAFMGSLLSGYISDKHYNGERGPLAVILYYAESVTILIISLITLFGFIQPNASGVLVGCLALIAISFSVNSTHSLIGSAAPMDIGGKKMSGFASGLIDSFQYFGGAVSLIITGHVLDLTYQKHGYFFWYLIMSLFGIIAGTTMLLMIRKKNRLNCTNLHA
ncbi:MAG: MFS transporter [Bdellovibrionaceae bacterium]|nr:MFS transporter [Pseudobdellovibrionaceae bacterium]